MMWQDIVLTLVGALFGVLLLPQVRDVLAGTKMNRWSTSLTSVGLLITAGVYVTLGLWIATATTAFTALVWAILYWYSR